jgi:hypothetical protein
MLTAFRRALRQVAFREGVITAWRHDGRIRKVKVSASAQSGGRPQPPAVSGGPRLGPEELAVLFLHALDRDLQHLAFRYGKFKFRIVNLDIQHTTCSVSIRPYEEGLLLSLCNGGEGAVKDNGVAEGTAGAGSDHAAPKPPIVWPDVEVGGPTPPKP